MPVWIRESKNHTTINRSTDTIDDAVAVHSRFSYGVVEIGGEEMAGTYDN